VAWQSYIPGFFNFFVFIYPRVTQQLRGNDDMNVLQALSAAIRCIPIPPRKRRNRGVGNAAVAGTATGRGGNGAAGTHNISGLRGGGERTTENKAATNYGTRNISAGLRGGAGGAVNAGAKRNSSVSFGDGCIIADKKKEEEQIMHNVSGPAGNFTRLSQNTVNTANASFKSIGKIGLGESQIEEEFGLEEMSKIEKRMIIADEGVGMLDTAAEFNPVEGEHIDIGKDEETGV
jgi:hypothetical protein